MGATPSTLAATDERDRPQDDTTDAMPRVFLRWTPVPTTYVEATTTAGNCPELMVAQGDLTACEADAIVNPANSHLDHAGGVAAAIRRKGGCVIDDESAQWIDANKQLPVGQAMMTTSGRLPCRYVIHTVGPCVPTATSTNSNTKDSSPTAEHAHQLRDAVWNALHESERLGLASVAMPGISSGTFGYPRDLAAREIVQECVRFCRDRAASMDLRPTTLTTIVFLNIDLPTCQSFVQAVQDAANEDGSRTTKPPIETRPLGTHSDVTTGQECERRSSRQTSGILLVRVGENDFEVLLGVEFRLFGSKYVTVLCTRGGGTIPTEESERMASCHRFSREIGGLLSPSRLHQAFERASRSVRIPPSDFTLHILHEDNERTRSLSDAYERSSGGSWYGWKPDHLVWVPWRTLVDSVLTFGTKESALPSPRRVKTGGGKLRTAFGIYQLSPIVVHAIQCCGDEIERHLDDLMTEKAILNEVARVDALKSMSIESLVSRPLHGDWKLRLTSPPLPPLPPLQLLQPSDAEYKRLLAKLPSEISSRVVSVRRVRASARLGEFQQHKQSLLGTVQEKEPLFHGTPERWRATAIAVNGFDLNIKLTGRVHGDGMYTSSDANMAGTYSANEGSLIHLRGLVTTNSTKAGQNTIVRGTVHVFPNPKALLPLTIADYAGEDERDQIEAMRDKAQDDYEKVLKRRREMLKAMASKEKEFEQATGTRYQIALQTYSDRLQKLLTHARDSADAVVIDHPSTTRRFMSASRQFFLERHHFRLCLPIYEVKSELVQLLRTKSVVILLAETGSGKSTQLPQLLLDDVLPASETRRVAILEPRRVNAISLCKRVSEERGLLPGQEVGYTIGRGESNAQMGVTRLEYMTHGLFVQLARDLDQLLSNYCAVIVDEAHERSVDVDLSLALLQRALKREQETVGDSSRPSMHFRLVVASATIGGEAVKFQRYLDPSMAHSAIFRVHGRTFPVHIQHRDDAQVDRQKIGSAGVGKVLSSAAIQSAVELLRTTESGNILVFLPGESCINDALDVARSEISMSATIEALDKYNTRSSAFCFRMSTIAGEEKVDDNKTGETSAGISSSHQHPETGKRRVLTTCVIGFHSKVSRAERDRVLFPRCSNWRLVIFTTNIAETGVTVPNIRYVIDTGLERRVRWNSDLDMNEMVTERVSVSSMDQRAGRAGRTASGICVRLFPENSVGNSSQPDVVPAVQNAMIYKAVLLNKQLESQGEPSLEMLDPIAPEAIARAQRRLVDLGALDDVHGKLTREGIALLRIGVDLRLGRFLIACARFNCLASGVKLASLLVATDAPERLLPGRKNLFYADRIRLLIDPSGDHLTLLNILEAYERAEREGRGISWCRDMGFDYDVFGDAEASREYLLKVLDTLQLPLLDDVDTMRLHGGKQACIRRALCTAFYDQLARPRMAATVKNGLTRVLDGSTSLMMHQNATSFAQRTQGQAVAALVDSQASEDQTDEKDQPSASNDPEPVVKLGANSTFWLPKTSAALATPNHLVVFTSLILTDSSTRGEPTVQLVTSVSQEDVKAGAPEWCRIVDFDQLLRTSARDTLEYELARGMSQTLLVNHGAWLKQLKQKFRSSVVGTLRDGKLLVSCPRRSRARVDHYVRKQLQAVAPESVLLQLPDHVHMGKFIGKGGHQIKMLNQDLESLLTSESRGAGHEHTRVQILTVDTKQKTVTITLQGASKPLMGVVVWRVQSAIVEFLGKETLPLVLDASGERGQMMQRCPRLAQLLNRIPPSTWTTRDDVMLQLAHALVWKCNANIHGGFLRDWVVRGDAAKDIDVQLAPPLTTAASIEQGLVQFMGMSHGARTKSLRIVKKGPKGAAFTLTISGTGLLPIDIDLVDRERLVNVIAPPGVDCDAGNLLLNRNETLRKKIDSAGDSLSAALENVHQKRFVFFYPLETSQHQAMSVRRLKQYLSRGWTCRSPVPHAIQTAFLSESERAWIHPLADAA